MKNYIGCYDAISLVAPTGGVTSGVPIVIGGLVAVPTTTAAEAAVFHGLIEGIFDLEKQTGVALAAGATCYWDSTNHYVNATSSGNTKIGVAMTAAASGDTTVRAILLPVI